MILKEDESPQFANLVSSDLDADRTDYLLRTAHATGLPYGNVDLEYLISQIQVDQEDRLAVTPKALRTADHFLLSRYFDYQQVVFHKTVVGAELVLKDVLRRILKDGHIDCSSASVSKSITEGSWHTFDEVELTNVMRSLRGESSEDGLRLKLSSVLDRRPPKLVGEIEFLGRRDRPTISSHNLQTRTLKSAVPELASEFGIDEGVWYTWSKSMALTKLSATLPASAVVERCTDDEEEYEKLVRVIGQDGTSVPITDVPHSLMHILADYALYAIRVYVLFPDGLAEAQHRRSIRGRLMGRLPESDWK